MSNWISGVGAFITFLAVVVALFGERLRAWMFRPQLSVRLLDAEGEATPALIQSTDPETGHPVMREAAARYYHVRVSNPNRWPVVNGVQVHLLRVEERGPDGAFRMSWNGDIPLRRRHQEVHPLLFTVGHDTDCDLLGAIEDKCIELQPLTTPFGLKARRTEPVAMRVTVQARGVEADSPPLVVEIAWDGKWADGTKEMARHLVLREIAVPRA